MPDTLVKEPQIRSDTVSVYQQGTTPNLMALLAESVERSHRERNRLERQAGHIFSISTNLADMLMTFDEEVRAEFMREFREALRGPGDALETMVREWFTTARAIS